MCLLLKRGTRTLLPDNSALVSVHRGKDDHDMSQ